MAGSQHWERDEEWSSVVWTHDGGMWWRARAAGRVLPDRYATAEAAVRHVELYLAEDAMLAVTAD